MVNQFLHSDDFLDRLRNARAQQQSLQRRITGLLEASYDPLIRQKLESAQSDVRGLDTFFRDIATSAIQQEERTANAKETAQKVFDIVEILEQVLLHVDCARDVLEAMRVNRQFRDAVLGSSKLQRKLSLLPDLDAYLHVTDANDMISYCSLPSAEWCILTFEGRIAFDNADTDRDGVQVRFQGQQPKLGSRCRQRYFCQPPPEEMFVFVGCCDDSVVKNDAGLTVGDLYEVAEKHLICASAACIPIEEVWITFRGGVKLRSDDPLLEQWWRSE